MRQETLLSRLSETDVVQELFLPVHLGTWKDSRFRLRKGSHKPSGNGGVRLKISSQSAHNATETQWDLVNAIHSLINIRSTPGFEQFVISADSFRCKDANGMTRLRLGLQIPAKSEESLNEALAARRCYRNLLRVIRKAGFVVENPADFDEATGLAGLAEWASGVRLRRAYSMPWWMLLVALIAALLFWLAPSRRVGIFDDVGTDLILVVDKSGSMRPIVADLRDQAKAKLAKWSSSWSKHYVNVVAYDAKASSAFGELRVVDKDTSNSVVQFLDQLQMSSGTEFRAGLEKTVSLISTNDRPVTVIVLTDAEDASILEMSREVSVGGLKSFKQAFQDTDSSIRAFVPSNSGWKPASGDLRRITDYLND